MRTESIATKENPLPDKIPGSNEVFSKVLLSVQRKVGKML